MQQDGLTVEGLIRELKRQPGKLPVVIHNQEGLPFTYSVIGVVSASNFDVAHLFDKSRPPPKAECVYLLVKIETEGS